MYNMVMQNKGLIFVLKVLINSQYINNTQANKQFESVTLSTTLSSIRHVVMEL